jgi:hypothetical protein
MSKMKMEYLNSLKPTTFMDDQAVKDNFISLYKQTRNDDQDEAEAFYYREALYFKRILHDTPALTQCTVFSLYAAFIDVVTNGLTFDPSAKLLYLTSRNANAGTHKDPIWEKRARVIISPYGELAIRIEQKQLRYIDEPVIVYACDSIKIRTTEQGNKVILYESTIPRTSPHIIASFVKLTRMDGSFDFKYLLEDDIKRLAAYSNRDNKDKGANALYSSANGGIDPGFLAAKTIKHAFSTFPKIKIKGASTELEGSGGDDMEQQPAAPVSASQPAKEYKPLPMAEFGAYAEKIQGPAAAEVQVRKEPETFGAEPVTSGPATLVYEDETF